MIINNFNDFTKALLRTGFSVGGPNSEGIFSLCSSFGEDVQWHTNDLDTDPWEWRIRVLDERNDIAYSKLFFRKSGYITKDWYPYFLAVRRQGNSFDDAYLSGTVSHYAKRVYEVIRQEGALPLHLIKRLGEFSKEDNSRFEGALVELQMKMFLTMCGRARKTSWGGSEYGWPSTVFCITEDFFGKDVFKKAATISKQDAFNKIAQHIHRLNPDAEDKKIYKFING